MEFVSGRHFTKQWKQFLQANDKLYESMELPTQNIRSSTEHRDRQAHGLMMEDEKDVLVGEYRKSPVFAGYHSFAPADHIDCLETLSIPIHLKMETEEFVALFWLTF